MMTTSAPELSDTFIFRRLRRSEQVTFVYRGISLMLFHMALAGRSRMGFVLAGGRSSRMGTDKALLHFDGETLLDRALATMRAVCDGVAIVGDPVNFADFGSVVADIFPGCGPLAGIHAALLHSTSELNLTLAVDMPFVSTDLLSFLFAAAEKSETVITVPRAGNGLQPLCAVYRRDFATVAEGALRAAEYKIEAAFSSVSVRIIEESELAAAGFSEQSFFNVNTPQDRLDAEGLA
jgi:molybdopterin-guanine dinucleotide biosynthesis protein A